LARPSKRCNPEAARRISPILLIRDAFRARDVNLKEAHTGRSVAPKKEMSAQAVRETEKPKWKTKNLLPKIRLRPPTQCLPPRWISFASSATA
jgi:methylphosphotriester-DNA--protein-cysteine methyltransferase